MENTQSIDTSSTLQIFIEHLLCCRQCTETRGYKGDRDRLDSHLQGAHQIIFVMSPTKEIPRKAEWWVSGIPWCLQRNGPRGTD